MDLEYTWHKFLNDLKKQTLNIVFVFLVSGGEKKLSPKGLKIKTTKLHFVSVINMGDQLHKHGHNFQWSEFSHIAVSLLFMH